MKPYKPASMSEAIPDTVALIRQLHKEMSIRQIVAYLNEEKVPTVRNRGQSKWNIRQVQIALGKAIPTSNEKAAG